MKITDITRPQDLTLKQLQGIQGNLRLTFLNKSPVIVFDNGMPRIVFEEYG